jgi:hypothetical protein
MESYLIVIGDDDAALVMLNANFEVTHIVGDTDAEILDQALVASDTSDSGKIGEYRWALIHDE